MKTIFMFVIAVALCGCAAYTNADGTKMTKAQWAAMKEQMVSEMLNNRRYKIDVSTMHPTRFPSKTLTSAFSLEVHGDTLVSVLPYLGRAYNIPYGGGKGLNFSAIIGQYKESKGKKDYRKVDISVTNDEDTYLFQLEVSVSGTASILVRSRNRDQITFTGTIDETFK